MDPRTRPVIRIVTFCVTEIPRLFYRRPAIPGSPSESFQGPGR